MSATRAICLDASALVKMYVDEAGSEKVREFVAAEARLYTTPLCFYEALNVLKNKYSRKEITRDQYDSATSNLVAWFVLVLRQKKGYGFSLAARPSRNYSRRQVF
jgi:predicted nucleic acid-binding protein